MPKRQSPDPVDDEKDEIDTGYVGGDEEWVDREEGVDDEEARREPGEDEIPATKEEYERLLFYGLAGSGKTALGVSSFWDWDKQKVLGNGKLITIGQERNPALHLPEECQKLGPYSLKLAAPNLTETKWLDDLEKITTALIKFARQGQYLDALVFDGVSEFNLLHEEVLARKNVESFDKWDGLMRDLFAIMQRLDPEELHCDIFMTARVMERRKERQSNKGKAIPGDPDFLGNVDYYPALRGSFRLNLPHYFNEVLYMETAVRNRLPVHLVHMVQTGKYLVKNQHEHEWLKAGYPPIVANPMWETLGSRLKGLANGIPISKGEMDEYIDEEENENGDEASN